ncbi:MAG TPA: ABC transporter substrate-binding protein, partial [Sphingomicrobium sp.]|nr:ABC transporter substrate-binding protein [Sphingomicrobium sp.]
MRLALLTVIHSILVGALGLLCLAFPQPTFAASQSTIVVGMPLEPPNLDPTAGAAAAVDEVVYQNIFEGLTRMTQSGSIEPALASGWTISPNLRVYIFKLRTNVHFHDGSSMTAADVKFSLDRARAPGSANAQKALLEPLAGVDVLDRSTVRIRLSRPYAELLSVLAWGDMVIVSPRSAANNATHPIGTGPFRFDRWQRGTAIELSRYPAYWGKEPALTQVTFKFFSDPTAAYTALRSGDVDAFTNYPAPENVGEFRADRNFVVTIGSTESKTILAINNAVPPLNNILVRRALSYAIDRKAIIQGAMFGLATPIGSHFSPGDPAYIDLTGFYPHDPALARALLAKAGYPNGLDLVLRLPPRPYARRSGEMIAAQLAAVGVRVRIENMEWSQWLDQVFGRHDFALTIVDHVEPMDYGIYGRPDYYFGYHSPTYNALLAKLDATMDAQQRKAILQQLQIQLARDAVNVFLFQQPRINIRRAGIEGLWANSPIAGTVMSGVTVIGRAGASSVASSGPKAGHSILVAMILMSFFAALGWMVAKLGLRGALRRLASFAATMVAATAIIFVILQIMPGDPARYMMGLNASPDAIGALHREMGLDAPAFQRYLQWVLGLLTGHFGTSYTYRVDVGRLIADAITVSLPLALLATVLSLLIAFPFGILAAAKRRSAAGAAIMGVAQAGIALPNFWLAMLLVLLVSIRLRWLPAGGFDGWDAGFWPALRALLLPAIALATPQAAILTRVLRSALVETMHEDYVRSARAKGLSRGEALRRHALRNALIPVLSVLGLQIPFLLAGAIIIENVFTLPGLGRLVFQAITQRDLIVVQGVVVVLVF